MVPSSWRIAVQALCLITAMAFQPIAQSQTARIAQETYKEGPVWQIMTFKTPPGKTEIQLKNIARVWEQQLKLAVTEGVLLDYKILTRWAANPQDWNIMVIEIFPNWASYDTFWEDWAKIDEQTVDTPGFQERFDELEPTGTEFLGTIFAREVELLPR